jgi:hypothetical protein
MRCRRLVLLAGVLVALNFALVFAPPGLAIRRAIVQQLFGPKLIRADVITKVGEWRLDRGIITQVSSTQLTLREADTHLQVIPLSAGTRVIYFGRSLPVSSLARRWRVVVTWPANGAAQSVDVTHALRRAIIQQLFGPKLIRADVIAKTGDWRLDRGVITQVSGSQLTLREADTHLQVIPLSTGTRLFYFGRSLPLSSLARHWRVLVLWPANGAAQSVDVEHAPKGKLRGNGRFGSPARHLS